MDNIICVKYKFAAECRRCCPIMHERIKFLSKLFKSPTYSISYIQTRFYYDAEDMHDFVILRHSAAIIRESDMERGYVSRDWVTKKFKHAIQYLRLTPRSCLVEMLIGASDSQKERRRLYVR